MDRWIGKPITQTFAEVAEVRLTVWWEVVACFPPTPESEAALNRARVLMMLEEGRFSQACEALSAEKVAPKSTGCL